jgi:Tfp pilus assembly protein PilV
MHGRLSEAMCSMNIIRRRVRGKRPAARRRRGLSIIEVAMASVLLIGAMAFILHDLTTAYRLNAEMERKTQSLVFAQGKLDEIKARSIYNFDSLVSSTETDGSYFCNIAVEATTSPDLKKITVKVGSILSPDEVEVTLATCIAKRW